MRRTHRLSLVVGLLVLTCLTGPATAAARPGTARRCAHADTAPQRIGVRTAGAAVVCLLNRTRAARGLRRLRSDPRLRDAATGHSASMAAAKFLSHTTPAGTSFSARVMRSGYVRGARGWALGENLAWGSGGLSTPAAVVKAWMGSPGHRANVLDGRFRDVGVGIADGAPVLDPLGGDGATYTADFGVRRHHGR